MRGEWKIIIGSALFALIPVGVKLAEGAGIYSILAGRLLIAAVVIFIFSKEKRKFFQLNKKDIIHLFFWSALMLVAMLCYFQSIRTCGVAISSALLGAQPVLIILFSMVILREKASWWVSFCALLTVLGILFVNNPWATFSSGGWGKLLALCSAAMLALIFIYQKKYLKSIATSQLVFYQSLFQLPLLLPFLIQEEINFDMSLLYSSLLLGTVCTAAAYFLIYSGVTTVAAGKIGILQSIEYILPVLIGVSFYQERLSTEIIVGCSLILVSCVLVNLEPKRVLRSVGFSFFSVTCPNSKTRSV